MFDFTIHPDASNKAFMDACRLLEDRLPNVSKAEPLIDVDGSIYQDYFFEGKKITIYNDYEVGAVYVQAECDLSHIFN